jgi:periplasmic divalent cation tolerance protein
MNCLENMGKNIRITAKKPLTIRQRRKKPARTSQKRHRLSHFRFLKQHHMPFLVFYITHPDEATARHIAARLLDERLIACANIFPIQSMYRWEGVIQQENEWVSIVKTRLALEKDLETALIRLHPYQTPCVLRYEVRANEDYEHWIEMETAGNEG